MTTESLIVLDGWKILAPTFATQERARLTTLLAEADFDGDLEIGIVGQSIADQMAAAIAETEKFTADLEKASKTLREPYFNQSKAIKAHSDTFMLPLLEKSQALGRKLAEFEGKKVRVENAKNAAAQAERDRQAAAANLELQRIAQAQQQDNLTPKDQLDLAKQAERAEHVFTKATEPIDLFESTKTEGVRRKVSWAFEVVDAPALANWCWKNERAYWVRQLEFAKREITEYLNTEGATREIDGLRVFEALDVKVKKSKTPKAIDVPSRVEL